ncbi:MAG TPA: hypothetical protein VGC20_16515, partial [bacterium]
MLASLASLLVPAAGVTALAGLGATLLPHAAAAQAENLINRISNERMNKFEERLTAELSAALSRYVSRRQ